MALGTIEERDCTWLAVIFSFKERVGVPFENRGPHICRLLLFRRGALLASSPGAFHAVSIEPAVLFPPSLSPLPPSSLPSVPLLSIPGIDVYLPRILCDDGPLPRRRLSIRCRRYQATANYSLRLSVPTIANNGRARDFSRVTDNRERNNARRNCGSLDKYSGRRYYVRE